MKPKIKVRELTLTDSSASWESMFDLKKVIQISYNGLLHHFDADKYIGPLTHEAITMLSNVVQNKVRDIPRKLNSVEVLTLLSVLKDYSEKPGYAAADESKAVSMSLLNALEEIYL